MRKGTVLVAIAAFLLSICARQAWAEDLYQFVWHGNSNFFQASFLVTETDLQLASTNYAWITSDTYRQSLSITRPDGLTIRNDWGLLLWFDNPDYEGIHVSLFAGDDGPSIYVHTFGNIMESGPHGEGSHYTQYWAETGYWTLSEVPEPSIAGLSVLGLLAFRVRKRKI